MGRAERKPTGADGRAKGVARKGKIDAVGYPAVPDLKGQKIAARRVGGGVVARHGIAGRQDALEAVREGVNSGNA